MYMVQKRHCQHDCSLYMYCIHSHSWKNARAVPCLHGDFSLSERLASLRDEQLSLRARPVVVADRFLVIVARNDVLRLQTIVLHSPDAVISLGRDFIPFVIDRHLRIFQLSIKDGGITCTHASTLCFRGFEQILFRQNWRR